LWLESDADCLLGLSIDYAFWCVEMEILVEHFGQSAKLLRGILRFATLFLRFWRHFKLNEDVAIASIVDSGVHSLIKTNSNSSKVDIGRRYLNTSIATSTKNFKVVLFEEGAVRGLVFGNEARSWIVEADAVFFVVVDVTGVNWHGDMVILLLKSSKCGNNLGLLIWLQKGLAWQEINLIFVLFWHFPLILQGDTRLIFEEDLLLRGDPLVNWWEEQLLIV
jgi:hypothetical protein